MGSLIRFTVRGRWLGQPKTTKNVPPVTAGYLKANFPLAVRFLNMQNRAAGAAGVAFVGLLPDTMWQAGQYDDAPTPTLTDDTADAQGGVTNAFALETTTNADGFMVGADVKFGAISLDITTASVGAGQVHTVEYWNGTAWIVIAATGMLIDGPRTAGQTWAAGEQILLFDPPSDWVKGSGAVVGGNQSRYWIRHRVTTAATTAGLAARLYVGTVFASQDALAANATLERRYDLSLPMIPDYYVAVGGVFATEDENNLVELVSG